MKEEIRTLEKAAERIAVVARNFGLDFFPVRFEICPADIIYTFGAYGMPTRFSHWSFGKAFYRMKMQYDYNLSRIYELVVNSDPCYAFLLEGNSIVQNKLVIAHVFAHCDFFKNNATFRRASRLMLETMSNSAQRIREMEFKYGKEEVEKILDAVLSIQEHVDPLEDVAMSKEPNKQKVRQKPVTPYDDLFNLDMPSGVIEKQEADKAKPERDIVKFIIQNGRNLKDWQREIVSIVREEMLYFYPQMETKIMNEGWASYWHARIMREIELTPDEALDFAVMHSNVIQPSRMTLNPYFLGYKIWENIEKRWDSPGKEDRENLGLTGGEGREKMFEVREMENDVSFIRNYLTDQLIDELDLYIYQKVGNTWQIVDKDCQNIRNNLVQRLTNCGYPYIVAEDGDYNKNGELLLNHCHEGVDLDALYLEKTLPHVFTLWGRTVHLQTIMDGKTVLCSFGGDKIVKNMK